MDAKLLVLHVIHDPAEAPGFYAPKGKKKKYLSSMEDAANEMMEEFMKKMREAHPNLAPLIKANQLLVIGTPVTRIIEIAKKKKAKMIFRWKSWANRIITFAGRFKSRTCCTTFTYPGSCG